jgi:hypothetical protein
VAIESHPVPPFVKPTKYMKSHVDPIASTVIRTN